MRYILASILTLIPCFWQSRIQAGDLSSHLYNAWLAREIAGYRAPGLAIVFQSTNVLFDWLLTVLLGLTGPAAAQRIAVAAALLIFVWGAFAFVTAVAGRRPWTLLPVLIMLAYGWVFHAGFFNFYLSLGLCFWAMALVWTRTPAQLAAAAALFALAWLGHNLPVLWSLAILAYAWIAARQTPARRAALLAACLAALLLVHFAIRATMLSQWYDWQLLLITGADQTHLFDDKYYVVSAAVFLVFGLLFIDVASRSGLRSVLSGIPFQIWLLSAAVVAIIPTAIIGAGFQAAFIADRMSLPAGICLCTVLATSLAAAPAGRIRRYAILATALAYFALLYRDQRLLNLFEDRLEHAVAQAPPGARVINSIDDPDMHVNALTHMIDRVCVGHCYSFANYEAGTAQFRIRVTAPNAIVAATYEDSWRMQNGSYVVKPGDLPLYVVTLDDTGAMTLRQLSAGEHVGSKYWRALPDVF